MENFDTKTVTSHRNAAITCTAISGHFATNHSHVNYYVDLTMVKVHHTMAKLAALELAQDYRTVAIDTVICLEGTEMIAGFLADALSQPAPDAANAKKNINVLAPELNANNQMVFRENTQAMVRGKNILLLVSTASTGQTINRALDSLQYYGGKLAGISAVYSCVREKENIPITSVFTEQDLPGYQTYIPGSCAMCEQRRKIDGIANSFGFSRLD